MDRNNSLLLFAIHDALFDKYFISFDDDKILISNLLTDSDSENLRLSDNVIIKMN